MIPKEVLKKVRQIHIRTKHLVSDVFAGEYHSVFKGRGLEFQEVREYVPGDEIRQIDWNVTARMGHPYVKVLTEERELTLMLLVDISASQRFGSTSHIKKDISAEIASLLALAANTNNDRVGLILFSDHVEHYIPPAKGSTHVLRIIREVLARDALHPRTAMGPALEFLNHVCTRRAVVFLVSDFLFDEDARRVLRLTARRHDLIGIIVRDPREESLIPCGLVEWQDMETGRRVLIDTSSASVRRQYEDRSHQRSQQINELLDYAHADRIRVTCGAAYERELVRFFKMREKRFRS